MDTSKNLAQLEHEVSSLGLTLGQPSGRNNKYQKKDYLKVLLLYNIIKKYGSINDMPMNLKFRLSFDSPQLASNYFDLKDLEKEDIWNNEDVWLTEKINGIRCTVVYSLHEKWSIFGRDNSEKNYMPVDYTERMVDSFSDMNVNCAFDFEVQLNNRDVLKKLKELGYECDTDFRAVAALMMMDIEILNIIKKDYHKLFKFKLLDVYYFGQDLRNTSYKVREGYFDMLVNLLTKQGFVISRPNYCKDNITKKAFHEGIMKEGGEGTIAVYTTRPCLLTGAREVKKDKYWIKLKKSLFSAMFDPNSLTDTVDGWVSHLEMNGEYGIIEKLWVSAYKGDKECEIAEVIAIPLSLRGNLNITEGLVVEISGKRWNDNGSIEEPVLEQIRFDKSKKDCKVLITK